MSNKIKGSLESIYTPPKLSKFLCDRVKVKMRDYKEIIDDLNYLTRNEIDRDRYEIIVNSYDMKKLDEFIIGERGRDIKLLNGHMIYGINIELGDTEKPFIQDKLIGDRKRKLQKIIKVKL